jgi:hypothetical protein
MRILRPFHLSLLSLACLGVANAQAQEERRAQGSEVVFVWCDDGQGTERQGTSYEFLEVDARAILHLPGGKFAPVRGLTATDILERWRGRLCGEGSMARATSLLRRGDDVVNLVRRYPVVDPELDRLAQESTRERREFERESRELERRLSDLLRKRIQGKDIEAISNGSLIISTQPSPSEPETKAP